MTNNSIAALALATTIGLAPVVGGLRAQAKATPEPPPTAAADAASVLARILATGRWHDGAARAYARLAIERARELCGSRVTGEFWAWLDDQPQLRRRVVWASAVDPKPEVYVRLAALWRAQEGPVEALPDLAVGFALAWSAGTDAVPALAWEPWTFGRSAIPGMVESFTWYSKQRRALPADIKRTNWQLAAFTALNDVPLDERKWALARYRGKQLSDLRHLFGEVPYIHEGLDAHPHTLANMVKHGGVCTVNTQYQMAVLRTLGCPATYGGGPGHVWPCWITGTGRDAEFERVNELGNADGTLGQWGLPGLRYESDLRLLTRAMRRGVSQLEAAELCAAAIRALGGRAPADGYRALSTALRRNPYAQRAWQTMMLAVAGEKIPVALAKSSLRVMARELAEQPRVALRLLAMALPRAAGGGYHRELASVFVAVCDGLVDGPDVERTARRLVIRYYESAGNDVEAARLRLGLLRDEAKEQSVDGADDLARTVALGGGGGSEFADSVTGDRTLRGLRYTTARYSGHLVIGSVQALYSDGSEGLTFGEVRGARHEVVVPDGQRLLGVEVMSGNLLDGFRLVTCPVDPRRAKAEGPVFGDWAGGSGNGFGRWLAVVGSPIVGIHGRSGSMVDALGLVARSSRR